MKEHFYEAKSAIWWECLDNITVIGWQLCISGVSLIFTAVSWRISSTCVLDDVVDRSHLLHHLVDMMVLVHWQLPFSMSVEGMGSKLHRCQVHQILQAERYYLYTGNQRDRWKNSVIFGPRGTCELSEGCSSTGSILSFGISNRKWWNQEFLLRGVAAELSTRE